LIVFNNIFYNTDHDPSADLVAQLAQEVYRTDLLQLLVLNIQKFEFEVRKKYMKKKYIYIILLLFIRQKRM
jgi:calcium binding protein 39